MESKAESSYEDEYISVEDVGIGDVSSYLVRFRPLKGRLVPSRIPKEIPRRLYKNLVDGETVTMNGIEYHGCDYTEESIGLPSISILFGRSKKLDAQHMEICMRMDMDGREDAYYVNDNGYVEYRKFYENQLELRKTDENCLIPVVPTYPECPGIGLESGDILRYVRGKGYRIERDEQKECSSVDVPIWGNNILFLGTGCSQPSSSRNVSSVVVEIEKRMIILDCGEDTFGQLKRMNHGLENLKIIYLSHSHADHVLGTARILRSVGQGITILGPRRYRRFLEWLADMEMHRYIETDNAKELEKRFYSEHPKYSRRRWLMSSAKNMDVSQYVVRYSLDGFDIEVCGCLHSLDSTSISIKDLKTKRRISYSGDTVPSYLFSQISMNSDVLIHEGTFGIECMEKAIEKNHTTREECYRFFEMINGKKLFLTHISNRYPASELIPDVVPDFYYYQLADQ
jgi:ribonuclease Z